MERLSDADVEREWIRHMRAGRFDDAWAVSDWLLAHRPIHASGCQPRHLQRIWNGTPIDGRRVLVRCYHGLGDTIQFARYLPLLRSRTSEVIVWGQPRLLDLIATVPGIDRLLPLHDGDAAVSYDVDVEIMELAYVMRSTIRTLPAIVPYLHSPAADLDRTSGPAVGLVWRAGGWAPQRSIPASLLAPLRGAPVTWHLVQQQIDAEDFPGFGTDAGCADIATTARVINGLDLLVTIDSMPAHLAGALGVPAWTLLPAEADWRWMTGRTDSPWYPTMRLFRQERPDEWEPVVERAAAELARLPAASSPGRARFGREPRAKTGRRAPSGTPSLRSEQAP